jgi:hypothetical protein
MFPIDRMHRVQSMSVQIAIGIHALPEGKEGVVA